MSLDQTAPPAPPGPALLTSAQVARHLGLSRRRVRELLQRRLLPGVRLNRCWLIPRASLDRFLDRLAAAADANVKGAG